MREMDKESKCVVSSSFQLSLYSFLSTHPSILTCFSLIKNRACRGGAGGTIRNNTNPQSIVLLHANTSKPVIQALTLALGTEQILK